jgi:hypothetical protein
VKQAGLMGNGKWEREKGKGKRKKVKNRVFFLVPFSLFLFPCPLTVALSQQGAES